MNVDCVRYLKAGGCIREQPNDGNRLTGLAGLNCPAFSIYRTSRLGVNMERLDRVVTAATVLVMTVIVFYFTYHIVLAVSRGL